MKKTVITLGVILAIFLSFGFIVMQKPVNDTVKFEKVSKSGADTGADLTPIQDSNEDQW